MTATQHSSHYQPDIQGMRTIAVALVIIFHAGLPVFPGGFIGVDIFFVISGYLITGLLLREVERSGTVSLQRFYARRFRRLLPALVVVLFATLAIAWFVYSPLKLKQFASSAFATAVYLSNFWFARLSTDYFAEGTEINPLLHTWSLGVEEQFYLFWPLLILLIWRRSSGASFARRLGFVLALMLLVSFVLSFVLTRYIQPLAFFSSPTRAWEFAAGGLVALWFFKHEGISTRSSTLFGTAGFVLTIASAVVIDRNTSFPGFAAVLPVAGTVLMIIASNSAQLKGVNRMLALPPMQYIGDMSYSLYLWHWPVFIFMGAHNDEHGFAYRFLAIAIVFVLSYLTLLFIENPVRFNRRLSQSVTSSLALGAVLTVGSAAIAFGVRAVAAVELQDPTQQEILAAEADVPIIYEADCHRHPLSVEIGGCVFGDPQGRGAIVLFGDSHAAHWFPAVAKLAEQNSFKLFSRTKSGCPSVFIERYNQRLSRDYTECGVWRDKVLNEIAEIKPAITVISNSYWYFEVQSLAQSDWRAATEKLLLRVSENSGRVVVLRDTPRPNRNVPDCLSHAEWLNKPAESSCFVDTPPSAALDFFAAELEAAERFENVQIIDINRAICNQFPCPVSDNGIIKFSDGDHLTQSFSLQLSQVIGAQIGFHSK